MKHKNLFVALFLGAIFFSCSKEESLIVHSNDSTRKNTLITDTLYQYVGLENLGLMKKLQTPLAFPAAVVSQGVDVYTWDQTYSSGGGNSYSEIYVYDFNNPPNQVFTQPGHDWTNTYTTSSSGDQEWAVCLGTPENCYSKTVPDGEGGTATVIVHGVSTEEAISLIKKALAPK